MRWSWFPILALMLPAGVANAAPAQLTLAAGGHTDYQIVVGDGANARHQLAAGELAKFLGEITGATFPVVPEREWHRGPALFVGLSRAAMQADHTASRRGLGADGLAIETVGKHLLLYGGEPRGTLYAVYTFLEDYLGCHWWTSTESTIPRRDTISIGVIHDRQVPLLEYREPFFWDAFDGDWAVRNKANSANARLTPEQGGKTTYEGFVHTFFSLVPPDKHFASHPEWYAMRDGKRIPGYTQLCLTNEELKRFVAEQVLERLRANPQANIVSVSQNDSGWYCECPACKALDEEEGSHAGSLLHFVNYVARAVKKEFPHVAIDTLAYVYTRKPPRHVRPEPNVIVRLCSIECNFAAPLTDPTNKAFYDDLVAWGKICKRLYVWDYVTNFNHYLRPQPNVFVIGPNVKIFARHGVRGLFEQGSYQSPGGDMAPLKAWVLAHMLWNPDRDPQALIREFVDGYYGAAGPLIYRYLDLLHRDVTGQHASYSCGEPVTGSFPRYDTMVQAEDLFRQAFQAVGDDPALAKRLRMAHLALTYTWLYRLDLQALAEARGYQWCEGNSLANAARAMVAVAEENHITQMSEGNPFDVSPYLLDRKRPAPPAGYEGVEGLINLPDYAFIFARPATVRLADPSASTGLAAVTPGSEAEQCEVQADVPGYSPDSGMTTKYKAFAVVKVDLLPGATGKVFSMAMYEHYDREDYHTRYLTADQVQSGQWQTWEYATIDLGKLRDAHLWVAPQANPLVKSVAVDRFFLVPVR